MKLEWKLYPTKLKDVYEERIKFVVWYEVNLRRAHWSQTCSAPWGWTSQPQEKYWNNRSRNKSQSNFLSSRLRKSLLAATFCTFHGQLLFSNTPKWVRSDCLLIPGESSKWPKSANFTKARMKNAFISTTAKDSGRLQLNEFPVWTCQTTQTNEGSQNGKLNYHRVIRSSDHFGWWIFRNFWLAERNI